MPATSNNLFEEAEAVFERGDFKRAGDVYREVLREQLAQDLQLTSLSIVALERIADIAYLLGDWERAEKSFTAIRNAFKQAGNIYGSDLILLKSAAIATSRGLFPVAREMLADLEARPHGELHELDPGFEVESLSEWEFDWRWPNADAGDRQVFFASLYLVTGRIAAGEGQYERAIALLKRGLVHAQLDDAQEAGLPLTLCLAAAYLERGDLLSASLTLDMLPDISGDTRYLGYAVQELETRARIDLLRGDLGQAKEKLERVLEICGTGNFEHAYAKAALNLAYVLISLNQTARATELCEAVTRLDVSREEKAIQTRAQFLIQFAAERGQSLVSGVAIAYSATEMQDAGAPPETVRRTASTPGPFDLLRSPNFLTLFEERALGFYWHLGRCDWKAAEVYLRELEMTFLRSNPPTDSLIIHHRLAALDCVLAYYKKDFQSARDGFEEVIRVLRRLNFKPELWQCLRFLQWSHARLGDIAKAEQIAHEVNKINRTLAGTLKGNERAIYQLNKWTEAETYLAAELNQLVRMKSRLRSVRGFARLAGLWQRIALTVRLAALLDQADLYKADVIERSNENGAPFLRRAATSWFSTLLRLLRHPRGQITVSFLVLPDRTMIARASWLSLDFVVTGATRLQLRELTSEYHQAVMNEQKTRASVALKVISDTLQLPALLGTLPARTRSLRFVPDDVLHGIPFAAIQYERAGPDRASREVRRYLVEDFEIAIEYEWLPKVLTPSTGNGVLVVSVPYGAPGIDPLPGADYERRQVLKWLTSLGVGEIKIKAPDKDEILNHLPEARFFHIACHGEFRPDAPSDSALLIVSAEGEVNRITLRELSHLDLSGLELAVLSSCWSADNFILPGRWIISLSETFWRAGARTVVGSLWPLDDEFGGYVIDKLYEALAAGASRGAALRQVQTACIRGDLGSEYRDPAYWAAVVLHGETGPLFG